MACKLYQNVCIYEFRLLFILSIEWVGDLDSDNAGRLGLWQICQRDELSDNCQKHLSEFMSIPSIPFQVSANYETCFFFIFLPLNLYSHLRHKTYMRITCSFSCMALNVCT